jgi:hypothetical protein
MRRRAIIRLLAMGAALAFIVGGTQQEDRVATLELAKVQVVRDLYRGDMTKISVFGNPEVMRTGVKLGTWRVSDKATVQRDSWFIFVDEQPGANWEHDAKYILIDKRSGQMNTIPVRTPPREILQMRTLNPTAENQMVVMQQSFKIYQMRPIVTGAIRVLKQKKYAVLVSGGWDAAHNYGRYWNDLAFIYKALKQKYNYTDAQIFVLYANGTHSPNGDLDGDGTNDIDYAATKANLTTVMNTVKNFIETEGEFFFYSTNHGGQEVENTHEAVLYLWAEWIRDDEFAILTKDIKCNNAFYVMEQCYSGGMMDDILTAQTYPCTNPKVCVMTAANHNEPSWACDTEGSYDEYVYHWTSAIFGKTPTGAVVNADANGDGRVSMAEAHDYAKNHDSRNEHPLIGSCATGACDGSLVQMLMLQAKPLEIKRPQ